LAAILIAGALTWFLENFERREEEIDVGYSAAARNNPFLAAERFLKRLDTRVQSVAGRDLLRDLPPPDDILVVNGLGVLNAKRREALHGWIAQGGRLVVDAWYLWDHARSNDTQPDDFLARYGVRLARSDDSDGSPVPGGKLVAEVNVEGLPQPIEVAFDPRFFLQDTRGEASGAVEAGEHARLLQYEIGDGLLTVTSDNGFLTNSSIGGHDHALFLALLTTPSGKGKVWLLYDSGVPWLGALLWRSAPFAIVSTLGMLGLLLWHLGGRLGPLLPGPAPERRDLLAHLQASAEFLWRHDCGGRLAEVTGARTEQAWLRRHPSLRELDREGRVAWIARRSGIPPAEVRRALYPVATRAGELVADTALLQRLWSSLAAPGSALSENGASIGRPAYRRR
jgi:hypothetical protein